MEKYFGEWVPYSGNGAVILGSVLLVIAGVITLFGTQLRESLRVQRPGKAISGMLVVVWILSILTFLVDVVVYGLQMQQEDLMTGTVPNNPITIYTLSFALLTFLIVFRTNRDNGQKVAFWSAALAAMAGPMIFELPFDLLVMGRTYPPIPPNPGLFRALFFLPLFLIELTTISLMFFSPLFKVSKYTLYALAGMFFVFAIWGFLSFSFAYTPEFLVLNVVAKALAFVTVVTLFLPEEDLAAETVP
ncbi:MAG TPA: hypothetical protein VLX61_00235 [Anaerolineales bacterium]|nr:hypothetical protein [Anaerolineales bacterium]